MNVPVADKEKTAAIMADQRLKAAVAEREAALNGEGRILVRPSGTEALVRVMVEAKEGQKAADCANELAELIKLL